MRRTRLLTLAKSVGLTLLISAALVFAVELTARGSFMEAWLFFQQPFRPGWTTIILFSLLIVFFDAILGRRYQGLLIIAPLALFLAFMGKQKAHYLGDPLYPADILYARQIVELLPLLARQRPVAAVGFSAIGIAVLALTVFAWRFWRKRARRIPPRARIARLAVAVPLLAFFASIMDYATFSWARDRLNIIPMMWDQKQNYDSNGFAIAFALNVPMAKITAPKEYGKEAVAAIGGKETVPVSAPADRPDIIVVMSESFWDPTVLPGVTITPDPVPTVRANRSGSMFSPEFGGMTANIEFEALTGFSNAFLPYGSIPYQQYVRAPMPSLASFLRGQGYATRALHPFAGWFWNRATVYGDFGFDHFNSETEMPPLAKRGPLVSDAAFTQEIIREADGITQPIFFFAVTLQGHGPYEPNRYPDASHHIAASMSKEAAGALATYAEGAADADAGLKTLMDWAAKREKHTIIAFFGDHLPPLGPVYTESKFMKDIVADRKAALPDLSLQHETPLVLWSNRDGVLRNVGAISPAYIPLELMRMGGFTHPYFTGFLGDLHDRFPVVDRNMLVRADGTGLPDWTRAKEIDPKIDELRLLQYDIMFGKGFSRERFFPGPTEKAPTHTG